MKLVQYKQYAVTSDTAAALRQLESLVPKGLRVHGLEMSEFDWNVAAKFVEDLAPHLDIAKAGRQVKVSYTLPEDPGPPKAAAQRLLETLWGYMVPLGFTPWDRVPLAVSSTAGVFTFLGPWQSVFDHMLYLGRGECAWPSVVCAAAVDAGTWKADRALERSVQAHLHRMGVNAGPVDGIVGVQTTAAMQELGLHGKTLQEVFEALRVREVSVNTDTEQRVGTLYIPPGVSSSIVTTGRVSATKGPTGARLLIQGMGQVVVSLGVQA